MVFSFLKPNSKCKDAIDFVLASCIHICIYCFFLPRTKMHEDCIYVYIYTAGVPAFLRNTTPGVNNFPAQDNPQISRPKLRSPGNRSDRLSFIRPACHSFSIATIHSASMVLKQHCHHSLSLNY